MSSDLAIALDLPAWAVPATPEPDLTVVGITAGGDLYVYGDTPDKPGPPVPAILGGVASLAVSQHGGQSRYGLRDYLDVRINTPLPGTELILRLPCGAPGRTSWAVRSLLGALATLDLTATAVKLQTRRGSDANFFRVFPHDANGIELPEVRAEAIGPSRDDLEIAIDCIRRKLGLAPLFPTPVNYAEP